MPRKKDFIVIAVLSLICFAAFFAISLFFTSSEPPATLQIMRDGKVIALYPLAEDRTIELDDADIVIEIISSRARFAKSDCADHSCVRFGFISQTGTSVICLPNRLSIKITGSGGADYDAVSGK